MHSQVFESLYHKWLDEVGRAREQEEHLTVSVRASVHQVERERDRTGREHTETRRVVNVAWRDWPSSLACFFFCRGVMWSWVRSQHGGLGRLSRHCLESAREGMGLYAQREGTLCDPHSADAK